MFNRHHRRLRRRPILTLTGKRKSFVFHTDIDTMTRWYVEPANPIDAVEIASLYSRVWVAYRGALANVLLDHRMPDAGKIERLMDDIPYFVIRSEGRIIAVARAKIEFEACYLERMVVDGEYRRKGVGTVLVEQIVEHARKNGAHKVFLNTSPKLIESIEFYQRMGFVQAGYFKKHFWGEDVVFFEMLLD